MTEDGWTLDPQGEERHLNPWLATNPPAATERRVLEFLAAVVRNPLRRKEDRPGVYSAVVPKTGVTLIWLLNHEKKQVVLVSVA